MNNDVSIDLQDSVSSLYRRFVELAPRIVVGLLVVAILALLLRFVRVRLSAFLMKRTEDKLLINFINSIFYISNIIIVILLCLYVLGFGNVASTILGAAGISAFVIGFAMKDIGENFLAGVIMAFDRPFRIGDIVKTGDVQGTITRMSLRDTHIKTFDGKDVFVPNGQIIKMPLYNYTKDGFMRYEFTIGVDYDTDVEQARRIILDEVRNIPGILTDEKPPRTHVKNLSTSTIDIECHYWIATYDSAFSGLELKSQAQSRSLQRLVENGIVIPTQIIEVKNL